MKCTNQFTYLFILHTGPLRKETTDILILKVEKGTKKTKKEVKIMYSNWLAVSHDLYSGNLVPDFFFSFVFKLVDLVSGTLRPAFLGAARGR